jgi:hypothetical protein
VSEIVIVIADLYLPAGFTDAAGASYADVSTGALPSPGTAVGGPPAGSPGAEHLARFGRKRALEGEAGWRAWLARRLGRDDLGNVPPAVIAAAALETPPTSPTVWLATPLHRIAGLTSVHLDRRSLLQWSAEEIQGFVTDFNRIFGDDPKEPARLRPLPAGGLLLEAPANLVALTTDPARALVSGLEEALPKGPQATPFKLLGAEIEMWLHSHPLNAFRVRRGALPVNALWLWGGGPVASVSRPELNPPASDAPRLFGSDPYLAGLARLGGMPLAPLPTALHDVPGVSDNARTVLVIEIAPLLHSNPAWSVFDVMADLDRRFITPALVALHAGATESLTLLANDIELSVRRRDRLKFWRRSKTALAGLQQGELI